ncbi:hypothetical protein RJ639_012454 [Escallonia herrerae]|uniref:Uncharacterized protein n=1 Tax=Escallonia herrerae TaxID=1293975 RepID=A0AA89ANY9_9ASTE|nr:hypothetical protein RJ639_012454 [Escallonia herrerae]
MKPIVRREKLSSIDPKFDLKILFIIEQKLMTVTKFKINLSNFKTIRPGFPRALKRWVRVDFLTTVLAAPTGHAVVMLQSNGQNSIVIVGGANISCWPETPSDGYLDVVRNAGIVLLQREIPDAVNIQAAKVGEDARGKLIAEALEGGGVRVDFLSTVPAAPTGHAVGMLQSDVQNSSWGCQHILLAWKLPDGDLEAVRNAVIVLLQREIPDVVNIQVARVMPFRFLC